MPGATEEAAALRALGTTPGVKIDACTPAYTFDISKAYGGYSASSTTPVKINSKITLCSPKIIENVPATGETASDGKNRVY